jgi:hypothetical protein
MPTQHKATRTSAKSLQMLATLPERWARGGGSGLVAAYVNMGW